MTGGKSYTRPAPKYVESGLLNGRFPDFPFRSADMVPFRQLRRRCTYISKQHTYIRQSMPFLAFDCPAQQYPVFPIPHFASLTHFSWSVMKILTARRACVLSAAWILDGLVRFLEFELSEPVHSSRFRSSSVVRSHGLRAASNYGTCWFSR